MTPKQLVSAAVSARWPVLLLKLLVVLLVVVFVGGAAREAWAEIAVRGVTFHPGVACAAGVAFLLGQAPMAWFWRQSLSALGQPHGMGVATRAFYISQLGKYVPGKASVVLIRTERMLRGSDGGCGRTIAACVFYETLNHMAVGATLSAGLIAGGVGGLPTEQRTLLALGSLGVAVVCFLPVWPPIARWLLARAAPSVRADRENDLRYDMGREEKARDVTTTEDYEQTDLLQTESALERGLTVGLMAEGWVASIVSWCGLGVSVWLAAWSVDALGAASPTRPELWLLAAALPVAAGFLSLLPAGVLVRDGLMLGLLAPALGEAEALATTLAVRLIWVVSEAALCGILVLGWRRPPNQSAAS